MEIDFWKAVVIHCLVLNFELYLQSFEINKHLFILVTKLSHDTLTLPLFKCQDITPIFMKLICYKFCLNEVSTTSFKDVRFHSRRVWENWRFK